MRGRSVRGRRRARGPFLARAPQRPELRPRGLHRRAARRAGRNPRQALHAPPRREVRELRFHLLAQQPCITYWLAPGRRIILLTGFRKTKSAEETQAARALQPQKTCEAEPGPAHHTSHRAAALTGHA